MTESHWELSEIKYRKWLRLILLTGIPVAVLAGIVYINNRDSFPKNAKSVSGNQRNPIRPVSDSGSEPRQQQIIAEAKTVPAVQGVAVEPVVLPEIICDIRGRGDIRLIVSMALFFSDEKMRHEILIRRNEIKILVEKVFSNKEMGLIKKEILEPELLKAVNGIFSREILTDIVLNDIKIEKVSKP